MNTEKKDDVKCERLTRSQYNSIESRVYTDECVKKLSSSQKFKRFCLYKEYYSKLYLLWFLLVPLIGAVLTYFWCFIDLTSFGGNSNLNRSSHDEKPLLFWFNLISVVYIIPVTVLLPFLGFFSFVSRKEGVCHFIRLTALHTWLAVKNRRGTEKYITLGASLFGAVLDVIPLQGFLIASLLVCLWRARPWERTWIVPMPVLFFPLFVGVVGVVFSHVANWSLFKLCSITFDCEMWGTSRYCVHLQNMQNMLMERFFSVLDDPETYIAMKGFLHPSPAEILEVSYFHDYQTLCSAACLMMIHIVSAILWPGLCCIFNVVMPLLPTHPTTWSVAVISGFLCIAMLFQSSDFRLDVVVAVSVLLALLFYNGFVA